MLTRWLAFLGCFGIVILSGCWEKDKVPPATSANDPTNVVAANEQADGDCCDAGEVTPSFHTRLREIAATYTEYGRFDGQMRWGSIACSAYAMVEPLVPAVRMSDSQDSLTHGRKLYSIFAKKLFLGSRASDSYEVEGVHWELRQGHQRGRYYQFTKLNPVGQVLVKESWVPEEILDRGQRVQPGGRIVRPQRRSGDPPVKEEPVVPLAERTVTIRERKYNVEEGSTDIVENGELFEVVDSYVAYVRKDGRLYHAAKRGPLFIMFKMDPKTPDTDEGWVFGTTTADGKELISAGRIESCMNCHQKAPHDRLFGLPKQ